LNRAIQWFKVLGSRHAAMLYVYTYIYVCIYMYVCVCVCVHVCARACVVGVELATRARATRRLGGCAVPACCEAACLALWLLGTSWHGDAGEMIQMNTKRLVKS
jgi:hypothetical protein